MWIKIIIVAEIFFTVGQVRSDESKACFGANGLSCTRHELYCINGTIIALCEAYYQVSDSCGLNGIPNCVGFFDNITGTGTHYKFNETEWKELNTNCSSKSRCEYKAGRNATYAAAFSIVKYVCIHDSETCHSYLTTPPPRQSTTNASLTNTRVTITENAHSTNGSISEVTTEETSSALTEPTGLSVNTGAVAGGVTVAVLVILAVVLLLLWFRQKRNQTSKPPRSNGKTPGENYAVATRISDQNYHDIETVKPKKSMSNYDYATVAGEVQHAGKEGHLPFEEDYAQIGDKRPKETGHNNATLLTAKSHTNKSFTENEDDYNHLAANEEMKTIENVVHSGGYDTAVSASKSVQQIRNKEVSNVDNDYDYNHIDNNPKPKPLQGDYDTTDSASKAVAKMMETNEHTEDDYDHFRQTKAGSQAADSPYDTAEHHAEHSGHYSIAGVLQKDDPYNLAK